MNGCAFPVAWNGRHATITLPGEIDIANARQAKDEISALLAQQPAACILDMTGTHFCDSSGIAALIHAAKRAAVLGVPLRLATAGPVTRILNMTGTGRFIATYPTVQAALSDTTSPPPGTGKPAT